jgi:hypothetical protein
MEGEWSPRCEPTPGLVRPVPIDPAGWSGPTRGQAAGPRWRRTSPGLFVPADVVTDVGQRIVEGAARLGHYGAVSGWAALRWRGAAYFDGHDREGSALPIPLAVGRSCLRPGEGIERLRRQIPLWEWDVHRGLRCALWERALYDEVIRLGTPRASAVAIDMVVAAGLGTIADYWAFLEEVRPRNGVVLSRAAAGLARGTSASPPESWMRLTWCLDAGCRSRSATHPSSTSTTTFWESPICSTRSPASWGSTRAPSIEAATSIATMWRGRSASETTDSSTSRSWPVS